MDEARRLADAGWPRGHGHRRGPPDRRKGPVPGPRLGHRAREGPGLHRHPARRLLRGRRTAPAGRPGPAPGRPGLCRSSRGPGNPGSCPSSGRTTLLAEGRKVAGILCEASGGRRYLGVGVNCGRPPGSGFRTEASGLAEELGGPVDRFRLLELFLARLAEALTEEDGTPRYPGGFGFSAAGPDSERGCPIRAPRERGPWKAGSPGSGPGAN
ncbi:MAG: hypothetical protein MZV64_09345 [Ignavibacteriales bacterium]|nr:hypothetical protein [Ignavibacteriales bacterium]